MEIGQRRRPARTDRGASQPSVDRPGRQPAGAAACPDFLPRTKVGLSKRIDYNVTHLLGIDQVPAWRRQQSIVAQQVASIGDMSYFPRCIRGLLWLWYRYCLWNREGRDMAVTCGVAHGL